MTESEPTPRDSPERYRPGDRVGDKYRLVRPLGQGGVGRVWVAHNAVLDVHMGLKLIHRGEQGATQVHADRLLQEARAAAKIVHPAIVRVFDFGETDKGDPFVVMELLHGETLGPILRREARLPATRAVQTLLPIADALATAHANGIVHRDVKPENIFIAVQENGRPQPKLLDFGIARMEAGNGDKKLTLQGVVLGTPDYMSPEQARGEEDVDERTDIWSLAVVLYELLTGKVPFDGENYNALLWAIGNEPAQPCTDLAAGDADLWDLIERGLRKDRTERWQSARAMGEAMAQWLAERDIHEDVAGTALKSAWLDGGGTRTSSLPSEPASSENLPTLPPESADATGQHGSMASPLVAPRRGRRALGAAFVALALLGLAAFAGLALLQRGAGAPANPAAATLPPLAETSESSEAPAATTGTPDPGTDGADGGAAPVQSAAIQPNGRAPKRTRALPKASGKKSSPGRKDYDFGF